MLKIAIKTIWLAKIERSYLLILERNGAKFKLIDLSQNFPPKVFS